MAKNYYEDLIEKLNKLIESNSLEQAKNIIEEELNLLYVPKIYQEQLEKMYIQVAPENKEKQRPYFSRDEIIEILSNESDEHSINFLIEVASMMDQYNWNGFENKIENIFMIKNLNPKVKSIIYNCLVLQNINFDFKIDNYKINPFVDKTLFEKPYVLNIINQINQSVEIEPSLREITTKILFIYIMNNFPASMFFGYEKVKNLTSSLISISQVMIGQKHEEQLNDEEQNIYKSIKMN